MLRLIGTPPPYSHNDPALHPDDGSTPVTGDVYETLDYIYVYNKEYDGDIWDDPQEEQNGWGVAVKDTTKTEYEPLLESINGKPVNNLTCTFYNCKSLIVSPVIPLGVTKMISTYSKCNSLTPAPEIPYGVTLMCNTFESCKALIVAPEIPSSVTNMSTTFKNCKALTTVYEIPDGVTNLMSTFFGCVSLEGVVIINSDVIDSRGGCFAGCGSDEHYITLTGLCPQLEELRLTGNADYITVE